jgi:hypothetical protein
MDAPVRELLEDLDRIRRSRREAEDVERAARQQRVALEAEENALLGVIMYRRAVNPEPLLEKVGNDARHAVIEFKDTAQRWRVHMGADLANGLVVDPGPAHPTVTEELASDPESATQRSKRPPTRKLLLALMRQRPERETWSPSELHGEMVRGGAEGISKNLVRVTLRRMGERQELAVTDDGRYGLRPQDRQLAIATGAGDGHQAVVQDMGDV